MTDVSPDTTTATPANRMTESERDAFLAEPLIGRLATVRGDGTPHLSPVWPVWEQGAMVFALGERRVHVTNLRRDPRATIIVDEDWRPQAMRYAAGAAAVVITGPVTVLDLASSEEPLNRLVAQHADKYFGGAKDDPEYWEAETGERYQVCYLRPERIISWDFRKAHPKQE
jgi:PPOX class probable F420-dependent enzyme